MDNWNKDDRQPVKRPQKRPIPKKRIDMFYIAVIFIGVIVCVIAFAVLFSYFKGSDPNGSGGGKSTKAPATPTPTESVLIDVGLKNQMTAVILALGNDENGDKAELYDILNGRTYTFYISASTELKDKYGQPISFNEFSDGDIVDAVYGSRGNTLTTLKVSAEAFTKKSVSNVKINPASSTITVGNDTYNYNKKIVCKAKDEYCDVKKILPMDTLTLKGYKEDVWNIEIIKGHGTIKVAKTEDITGALLEIDEGVLTKPLDQDLSFDIVEGEHKAVVKGSNIETYNVSFKLAHNEIYEIDLTKVVYLSGMLTIVVNEFNAKVTVNGEEVDTKDPIMLDFGEYVIVAEKEGFIRESRKVNIEGPKTEVKIELKEFQSPPPTAQPTPMPPPTPAPTEMARYGSVSIATKPDDASVIIDGVLRGQTPINISEKYGSHTLTLSKSGYEEITTTITIGESNRPINIALRALGEPVQATAEPNPTPGLAENTLPPNNRPW